MQANLVSLVYYYETLIPQSFVLKDNAWIYLQTFNLLLTQMLSDSWTIVTVIHFVSLC
jgi:hypothetical protein